VRVINGAITVLGVANIHVDTLELAADGKIDGTGGSHDGNNQGPGKPKASSYATSHGGSGYGNTPTYGSVTEPTTTGSGGWTGASRGGAALHLTASSTVILNGMIQMDGFRSGNIGGGSGGSVWITTNLLQGSGASISAQGADGYEHLYGAGGGGRVALICARSEYTGYTNLAPYVKKVPTISVGGGKGTSTRYPHMWSGSGTAYINCGDADRLLMIGNRERNWRSNPLTTIIVDENIPGAVFHNVLLYNGSRLTFSRPPSSPLDKTTAAIASVGGDNTGSLTVKTGDLVFLGSNLSVVPSLDTTTVARRAISLTERQIITTHSIYTATVGLTGASVCVDAGGKLDLSSNVYICGSQLVNRGLVTGVATIDKCTSNGGGFFYLGNPDGSTACGTDPVDGKVGGCMTKSSPSYSPLATVDEGCGSTSTGLAGCTFPIATNYNPLARVNDGSCVLPTSVIFGCTYTTAYNYLARADIDDGSCVFPPPPEPATYSPPVVCTSSPPSSSPPAGSSPSSPGSSDDNADGANLSLRPRAHLSLRGHDPTITFKHEGTGGDCSLKLFEGKLASTCPTLKFNDLSGTSTGECTLTYDGTKIVSSCALDTAGTA